MMHILLMVTGQVRNYLSAGIDVTDRASTEPEEESEVRKPITGDKHK
jgi:hypothetical protein